MAPPTADCNHNKAALRRLFDQKRKALSLEAQKQKSRQLLQWLPQIPAFVTAKHIAMYWPMGAELSPLPLLTQAQHQNKHCYLPVLRPGSEVLTFVAYQAMDPLMKHPLGFLEPALSEKPILAAKDLDLIILPLLAFDDYGQRLGRGAGHYDRTLHEISDSKKPYLLGLGYACQHIDRLPTDPWDYRVDGVLTEEGYSNFLAYSFNKTI